ncbi:MAG: hypothetical protein E7273_08330 [Pseudobutyrivibrio ruminis]|nr:hypothetical protein [Pseudobutyrivibrio ruminis]
MSIKKIIVTKGIYQDKELRLLVSFDENDKPLDLINLDVTKNGEIHEATVEKVLNDIDACIVKLDNGDKGFIENRKLKPDCFLVRHSEKKLVCQADKFYVQISQDRKGVKPYSCDFICSFSESMKGYGFLNYYVERIVSGECEIISDLSDFLDNGLNVRYYEDDNISLWNLYGMVSTLDKATSKIVHLKSGSNIVIEPTEALTVIDVNTSKNYGKSTAFDTNIEAIKEIAKQVRLRSISGIIIIDLLKVSKEKQVELMEFAKQAFSNDYSQVTIHGFTNLGLLEITRSRIFAPLIL